ncbi:MAG: pyridine nucleotide-disulfide oxidoreductase [Cystobacterineae bacterium]|nr:pyridine nucleotide-disulfide oxidoreductase [Cystobacterineae bacterium]
MKKLGIDGFDFEALHQASGLARLYEVFLQSLQKEDLPLSEAFSALRAQADTLKETPQSSQTLMGVARHYSRFLSRLFGIGDAVAAKKQTLLFENTLAQFRREFVARRAFKKGQAPFHDAHAWAYWESHALLLLEKAFGFLGGDEEAAFAHATLKLMEAGKGFSGPPEEVAKATTFINTLKEALRPEGLSQPEFAKLLLEENAEASLKSLLQFCEDYCRKRHAMGPSCTPWESLKLPVPMDFEALVEAKLSATSPVNTLSASPQHLRRRQGFGLTDKRGSLREVACTVDDCIFCHERGKDSCRKGLFEKAENGQTEGGQTEGEGQRHKKNPLGLPQTGCPLDEHISEAHKLRQEGDVVAALAMVAINNPLCAGTGHRICNDCMRACIFQKQEPVNIPLVETNILTDVLSLPFGVEIYALMTRFNPVNVKRPFMLPPCGQNVLVTGLGPAGYMLCHYLANEGFVVAGIDGLKLEALPDAWTGKNGHPLEPIENLHTLWTTLDKRRVRGFGGVSEYGITVRWDKNFLTLLQLILTRHANIALFGGVRLGGTLRIEDAWQLGFHHVALATGAGRPTLVPMHNNLLRGMRTSSDFLMGLQLSSAFKMESMANLQIQLPALVIGGGLTAIDTVTELLAYYPVQVEKALLQFELLCTEMGEENVLSKMDAEEQAILHTFLKHAKLLREERERAHKANEAPNYLPLLKAWGGVKLCYRRTLRDSPAYRMNHEEINHALAEGMEVCELLSPTAAVADDFGAVKALKFEQMQLIDGKLSGTGQHVELPARTVCIAAGTSPNTVYEKEHPGTFLREEKSGYFQTFKLHEEGAQLSLQKASPSDARGFFTSYVQPPQNPDEEPLRLVSVYGDNHPGYAGNVVRAMASARNGYPQLVALFAKYRKLRESQNPAQWEKQREALFATLNEMLLPQVVALHRLTSNIFEVVLKAPMAAKRFQPGQFFRLHNFEQDAKLHKGKRLSMEGVALTGAWVDADKGLISVIALELGASSKLCANLKLGQRVVLMGPTGEPTEIPLKETVFLAGGGLGNAVLFSIGQALRAAGCRVVYFAGFKHARDTYKTEEVERAADEVVWSVDDGEVIAPRRPQDKTFKGNIVQAMEAYVEGALGQTLVGPGEVDRIIAIGSDRMMMAVRAARKGKLSAFLKPTHTAIGSINSPMQCMLKEICAQCLQRHVDIRTGKESFVFSCFNQDQALDAVDFAFLHSRLKANSVQEKLADMCLPILQASPPL